MSVALQSFLPSLHTSKSYTYVPKYLDVCIGILTPEAHGQIQYKSLKNSQETTQHGFRNAYLFYQHNVKAVTSTRVF